VQGHRDYVIKTLLHGMTGPLAGQTFTQVMLPMGAQTDPWIANIASYIRNTFGNSASFVSADDVARVRRATANRKSMWTFAELEATLPRLLPADPSWTATASHNPERAAGGLTLGAWTTGVPQEPGMWFQVELPQPALVTEVHFDSGAPGGRGAGRGFGAGRGGRGPAAGRGGQAAPAAGSEPTGPGRAAASPAAAAPASGTPAATAPATPVQPGAQGAGRGAAQIFGSYPLAYRVQVSEDGKKWSAAVAEGKGSPSTTIAAFAPVRAKFIRVTQTEKAAGAPPWSVLNVRVYVTGQ
jgi:hypothetical protein